MLAALKIECKQCHSTMDREKNWQHDSRERRTKCPYDCATVLVRSKWQTHMDQCERGIVVCDAGSIGCPWIGKKITYMQCHIQKFCRPIFHELQM